MKIEKLNNHSELSKVLALLFLKAQPVDKQTENIIKACLLLVQHDLYNQHHFDIIKVHPDFAQQIIMHAQANRPDQIPLLPAWQQKEIKPQA